MKRIIFLYGLSMPFVSAFALSSTITFSLLIGLLMLGVNVYYTLLSKERKDLRTPFIPLAISSFFLLILLLSLLLSYNGNMKAVNHFIAYSTTFILFFNTVLFALCNYDYQDVLKSLLKGIYYSLWIACIFTIIEFLCMNVFFVPFQEFIPRPMRVDYNPTALSEFFRARGFAPESGHHGLMLEILAPIAIIYPIFYKQKKSILLLVTFVLLVLINFFITFSSASFLSIGLVVSILLIFNALKSLKLVFRTLIKPRYLLIVLLGVVAFLGVNNQFKLYYSLARTIEVKLGNSGSKTDRTNRLVDMIPIYQDAPVLNKTIGYGPSGFRAVGLKQSIISLYPTLLFESGFLGLLAFLFLFFLAFVFLINSKHKLKNYLAFSLLAGLIHYTIVGDYWYPWIWVTLAIIYSLASKKHGLIMK